MPDVPEMPEFLKEKRKKILRKKEEIWERNSRIFVDPILNQRPKRTTRSIVMGDFNMRYVVTGHDKKKVTVAVLEDAYHLATTSKGTIKSELYRENEPDKVIETKDVPLVETPEPPEKFHERTMPPIKSKASHGDDSGKVGVAVPPGTEAVDPAAIQAKERSEQRGRTE